MVSGPGRCPDRFGESKLAASVPTREDVRLHAFAHCRRLEPKSKRLLCEREIIVARRIQNGPLRWFTRPVLGLESAVRQMLTTNW